MKEVPFADSLVPRVYELHEVGVLGQEVEGVKLVLEEVVAVEAHAEDAGGDEGDDNLVIVSGSIRILTQIQINILLLKEFGIF